MNESKRRETAMADHAWAAGIFEGEGHTTGAGQRAVRIGVSNTNLELLTRFQKIMGGCGTIRFRRHQKIGKPMFAWDCSERGDALLSLNRMWDWLTEEKREKARKIMGNSTRTVFERTCKGCAVTFAPTGTGHWFCTPTCREHTYTPRRRSLERIRRTAARET